MPPDVHRTRTRGLVVFAGLLLTAGSARAAAATTPFTWAADLATAVPIGAVTLVAVARWPARPDRAAVLGAADPPRPRHPYLGWVVLGAAVVGWELVEYLWRGSRGAHPTLSSMADAFDAHSVGKTLAFLAWLWLGAAIVRAGTPLRSRSGAPGAA